MEANFTETKNSRLLKDPLVTRGVMAFQSPDRFRREIQGNNKSLTVSNGKTLWIYYPNFNEVEVYDMGAHSFFDDSITALISGLSYKKIPEVYNVEAFREASGYRLELTPKKRNLRRIVERMTLWINEDLEPARTVVSLPKGDRIVTQYSNVRRRGFPASDFEFSPPAGASISRPMGKK